jgi:hypothetical protein
MNGKLKEFKRGQLNIPETFELFKEQTIEQLKNWTTRNNKPFSFPDDDYLMNEYDKLIKDEIWVNDEYQVNIDKNVSFNNGQISCYHLSIKRKDKQPIHDWRDLQEIKNMLVGKQYEAIELYPSENRKVDTANQYHLWVFIKHIDSDEIPVLPIGFNERIVTSSAVLDNGVQRPL